ncbi:MAG: ACP S-malonyltransferase, partial [Anaerolineae bacterium]|nr:ACP S-malonyltransferase [Anaerolineae bacterium]
LSIIAEIEADLRAQLTSRVRWTESIQYMISQGVETFIELGSRNVLTGLLRRIDRSTKGIPLGEAKDFEKLA